MFGKHWSPAQGLIVDRRVTHSSVDGPTYYEFVVDVTTAEGEVFRTKAGPPHLTSDFMSPQVGMNVKMEYEAKSRDVRFDMDDPQLSWKAHKKGAKSGFDNLLGQAPGTPAPNGGSELPAGFDLDALLAAQGLTGGTQVFEPTVVEVDGVTLDSNSPEAAALRQALLQALGQTPPPPSPPPGSPDLNA